MAPKKKKEPKDKKEKKPSSDKKGKGDGGARASDAGKSAAAAPAEKDVPLRIAPPTMALTLGTSTSSAAAAIVPNEEPREGSRVPNVLRRPIGDARSRAFSGEQPGRVDVVAAGGQLKQHLLAVRSPSVCPQLASHSRARVLSLRSASRRRPRPSDNGS